LLVFFSPGIVSKNYFQLASYTTAEQGNGWATVYGFLISIPELAATFLIGLKNARESGTDADKNGAPC